MRSLVIKGYASLFGVEGMAGDVVRAVAFSQSLSRGSGVGKLLRHVGGGRRCGWWGRDAGWPVDWLRGAGLVAVACPRARLGVPGDPITTRARWAM